VGARSVIPAQGPGWGREICWCKARLLMFSPPLQPGKLRLQHQASTEKPNPPLPGSSGFVLRAGSVWHFQGPAWRGVSKSQRLQSSGGNLRGWSRRRQSPVPARPGRGGGGCPAWVSPGDAGTILLAVSTQPPQPRFPPVLAPV